MTKRHGVTSLLKHPEYVWSLIQSETWRKRERKKWRRIGLYKNVRWLSRVRVYGIKLPESAKTNKQDWTSGNRTKRWSKIRRRKNASVDWHSLPLRLWLLQLNSVQAQSAKAAAVLAIVNQWKYNHSWQRAIADWNETSNENLMHWYIKYAATVGIKHTN